MADEETALYREAALELYGQAALESRREVVFGRSATVRSHGNHEGNQPSRGKRSARYVPIVEENSVTSSEKRGHEIDATDTSWAAYKFFIAMVFSDSVLCGMQTESLFSRPWNFLTSNRNLSLLRRVSRLLYSTGTIS